MKTQLVVMGFGCHPDDIEFMMAGTLFALKSAGHEIHYMNLANGNCGSLVHSRDEIEMIRQKEAKEAAQVLGATWHPSFCNDMEVIYDLTVIRKIVAVLRKVKPDILLIPALKDYMEDHMNTSRMGITAAFALGIPNFVTIPETEPVAKEIALYHAMPYGLHDGLMNKVEPHFYIDITSEIDKKEEMLACHHSQRSWLGDTQKLDSYLQTMRDMSQQMGTDSKQYEYAEGWIRHNPLGYSSKEFRPLEEFGGV